MLLHRFRKVPYIVHISSLAIIHSERVAQHKLSLRIIHSDMR